jgi:predicted dehydrogenase
MQKLKMGMVGLGLRGRSTLDLILKSGLADVAAVCDAAPGRLDDYAALREQGAALYTDTRALLEDKNVDALFIATPDGTHGELLSAALRAGKHAVCEKPLEITEEKINAVVGEARGCDRVVALGYVLRYAPLFRKVKELVSEGAIGRVLSVNAVDNICYGGYAFFHDWHRCRKNVTSLLLQKASHSLDVVNWLVDSRPVRVAAFGGLDVFGREGALRFLGKEADPSLHCAECERAAECPESLVNFERVRGSRWMEHWPDSCVYSSEVNVDDNQALIVQYENSARLSYTLNQFTPEYKREYNLIGDVGQLRFDDVTKKIIVTNRENKNRITYEIADLDGHGGGDEGLLRNFVQCCRTGEKPVACLESGAVSALLALAAQRSIDEKRMVTIDYTF